jgi:hypothetical protein
VTTLQTIPKAALEGAIRIARLPADALVGVAPETRVTSAIGAAVDRVDATVRSVAGRALGDTELQREAGRLRRSGVERQRGRELDTERGERDRRVRNQDLEARGVAEKRRREADLNAARKRAGARRRREQARAEAQRAEATAPDPLKGAAERAQAERRAEDAKVERGS